MNDRSTLAATEHDDRDWPPATPDPTTEPHEPEPAAEPEPVAASAPEPPAPPAAPGDEPSIESIRTLLETAATCRPLEEVTALVSLLKETGQLPNPGHEAIRAAAVSRPVDEVMRLIALLGEYPHEEVETDIALRAAAVGRPIEDVALLVSILGPAGTAPAPAAAPTEAPPAAAPPPAERTAPTPVRARVRAPAARPVRPQGAPHHLLRWPTAAALLLCGVLHLPEDLAALPAPTPGDLLPLAAALLCLVLGALLAVRDTTLVWRAAAVTALTVVTLHVVGGVVFFDPLEGALGGPHAWAGVTAVLCAGAGAVLAGVALKYRPPRAGGPGGDA
ncbi:hypothetical protein ACWDYJ_17530 [Streptomyces sp. NPDC003042]